MDRAASFINRRSARPFMMMLSTPACHAPFTSAPQYEKKFTDVTAPRNGSFNVYSPVWQMRHVHSSENVTTPL